MFGFPRRPNRLVFGSRALNYSRNEDHLFSKRRSFILETKIIYSRNLKTMAFGTARPTRPPTAPPDKTI
jgi:hypothetical protein